MLTVQLEEFESVMLNLAGEEGWTFCDDVEDVAVEGVFNHETYGPALLFAAQNELRARELPIELGVDFEPNADALLGVSAVDRDPESQLTAIWRLCTVSFIVDQLPRRGAALDLAILRNVFDQNPELVAQPA